MKKMLLFVFLGFFTCMITYSSYAVVGVRQADNSISASAKLGKAQVEKMLGRELTFQEKLFLPILKAKLKNGMEVNAAAEGAVVEGWGIASMIVGLVSLFIFGLLLGLTAICMAALSMSRIKRMPDRRKGKGFAIAGLVLGIIGVIGWAIAVLIILG